MNMVMIQCPRTGRPIPTGIKTDKHSFNQLPEDIRSRARCPLCGQDHGWRKKDAWFEIKEEWPKAAKVA
jgi:hypothetical protein